MIKKVGDTIQDAATSYWVERVTRLGYVVRGAFYLLVGFLGLQLGLGLRNSAASFSEVIVTMSRQPFGQIILGIVFLGLVGYSLWGIIRAVFNVTREKDNIFGWVSRLGFLVSAISYGSLAWVSWSLLRGVGMSRGVSDNPEIISAKILSIPLGRGVLLVVGGTWIAGAIGQGVLAAKSFFKKDLKMKGKSEIHKIMVEDLGQIGYISRAMLLGLVGIFIVRAAWLIQASKVHGLSQTLEIIKTFKFGPEILGGISLGLMAFGTFSILSAQLMKFPRE